MGVVTALGRGEKEDAAVPCAGFRLRGLDECTSDSAAAPRLLDHERTEFCSGAVVLDRRHDLQMRKTHDLSVDLCDKDAVADDREAFEPCLQGARAGRVAKLVEQPRDGLGIAGFGIADQRAWITIEVHGCPGRLRSPSKVKHRIMVVLGEVLTAIVTPLKDDGAVDYERFRELALHLVANGSDGIVVAGTTGESPTLSDDERLELFRVAVDALGGRATVIAGTGTYSTSHSIHLTREAHDIGVDGFLVVTPYYNKPPQRGIVAHFEAIAAVSDRPIIVYNIPARVVVNIEPETIVELAQIPNVTAVKQANDDLSQARRIVEDAGLDLYAGDDNILHPFLEVGAVGGVCVHTHVAGPQVKAMVRAYRDGDVAEARRIDEELEPAYDLLKVQTNPIAIKAALNLLGHEVGGLRLPLVAASDGEVAAVRNCLERLGVLAAVTA